MRIKFLFSFALMVLLASCNSDDEQTPKPPPAASDLLYIANEGSFNQGNANLTVYDPSTSTAFQNAFSAANGGEPLGDIFQSITQIDDELFFVVNNSQKIEVVNAATLQRTRSIGGLTSPRYMLPLSGNKAYVSDLFAGAIHIIDTSTGSIIGAVNSGQWVERMVLHNAEVWASTPSGDGLIFIDPSTDSITGSLALSAGANSVAVDATGDVWVYCQGDFMNVSPAIYRIHRITKTIESTFNITATGVYGGSLEMDHTGHNVYYLFGGDVYKMAIDATSLPSAPFISANGRVLYGMNVNRSTGQIALTDAADFSSTGHVYLYNPAGTLTTDFEAGIIPGFAFWAE